MATEKHLQALARLSLVTAGTNVAFCLLLLAWFGLLMVFNLVLVDRDPLMRPPVPWLEMAAVFVALAGVGLGTVANLVAARWYRQVRNRGCLLLIGALNCLPCWSCPPAGLPVGLYALWALTRPEIQARFAAKG